MTERVALKMNREKVNPLDRPQEVEVHYTSPLTGFKVVVDHVGFSFRGNSEHFPAEEFVAILGQAGQDWVDLKKGKEEARRKMREKLLGNK